MYFLHKEGAFGHSVFWIGDSEPDGIKAAKEAARNDEDDYHSWVLYKFQSQEDFTHDPKHAEVFRTKKSDQKQSNR